MGFRTYGTDWVDPFSVVDDIAVGKGPVGKLVNRPSFFREVFPLAFSVEGTWFGSYISSLTESRGYVCDP